MVKLCKNEFPLRFAGVIWGIHSTPGPGAVGWEGGVIEKSMLIVVVVVVVVVLFSIILYPLRPLFSIIII